MRGLCARELENNNMQTAFASSLAAFIVVATVLPLVHSTKWWIRGWDFPRLQVAILGVAGLVFEALVFDLGEPLPLALFALTLACTLYQAWWILPYTWLFPREVRPAAAGGDAPRLRLMTANVLRKNRYADGLLALVRQHRPDILVTLESDSWWEARLAVLEDDYPHTLKCPLDNAYGMHVFSRLPLEDAETQFLVMRDIPSMHARVSIGEGRSIELHFLHPTPPSPSENEESLERDAELLVVARHVARLDQPVIVAGDLNDVAWSRTTRRFRKLSGLLDPRIGRGMCNTFHAKHWFMRWPLDHLFHSGHFTLAFIRRLPAFGSDHFPVLAELVLEEGASQESQLSADAEDRQVAREKIREAGARPPSAP